jgi:ribA/ribD-fused uncharacterized protein
MKWSGEDGTLHEDCAVFFKVDEEFGGLSNMAGGYPLRVNGVAVTSSEALYQACRFPQQPDWQREIITQASPMAAKMKSKKEGRRQQSRPDWSAVQLDIMRWVLRIKFAQHPARMGGLFERTGNRAIVERSRKDPFWGAVEKEKDILNGSNHLGRLLMELRDLVRTRPREELLVVEPLAITDFLLLGQPIETVRPAARA